MPRPKRPRRFEPRYGVSQITMETEAGYLAREIEDYSVLAPADIEGKLIARHADCEHCWKHFQLLLEAFPERERRVIHCLLYRDLYLVLELYLTHLRLKSQPGTQSASPAVKQADTSAFSEWLFKL